ncbi:MAG: ArnT family glycosyltransferase [Candidatus Binatia bacterium]
MTPEDRFSLLFHRTCLLGSFLGFAATLYFLAGLSGHIGNFLLNISTAGVLLLGVFFFLYVFFVPMRDNHWLGFLFWLLILAVLLAEIVLGLVPPAVRDELIHHLAIPRLYVEAGRIIEVPFALFSYRPMLLDMLYTPFIKWGWDSVPKLVHGLFGFLTGLLLYAYVARRLNPVYGLLAFFLFISTPIVLRLSNLAYVGLGLTFYSTASLLCLLKWKESGYCLGWMILAGLLAGFALSTKPNGLLVFFLLFSVLVFILGEEGERGIRQIACWALLFFVFAFLPFGPWVLKNISQTGNPFFPLFTSLFGSLTGGENGEPPLGILSSRQLLYGESGWQVAALPLRVFFSGQDNSPQYFDGVLNPMLILFLPWAFKGKWVEEKRLLFGFAVFYFLYALFLVDLRIRYILPIIPPLVVLLVFAVHNLYLRILRPSWLWAGLALLVAWNGLYLVGYFRNVSPVAYLAGLESREAYLGKRVADFPAMQYINRHLPVDARVYLLFTGNRGYYCQREYFYDTGESGRTLLRILRSARDEREIRERLGGQGITHILVRQDLLRRFLNNNITPRQQETWDRFQNRYLRVLFELRGYGVYEVRRNA